MNTPKAKKWTDSPAWLTGTAMMVAVTLVLANTPLGRITMPFLTATTLHIPVIIATLVLGWQAGMITGLVFGVHSLISNLTGASFFAPFFINPLVSVVPRVLFPLFVYGIQKAMLRTGGERGRFQAYVAASALGTVLHTFMVMGMIYLLYAGAIEQMLVSGANVPEAIASQGVGMGIAVMSVTNGLPEMLVAVFLAPVLSAAVERALGRAVRG